MRPKPLAHPSGASTGLQAQSGVDNLGWGSPAWSPISLTNNPPPSPANDTITFHKDFTSALHEKLGQQYKIGPPTTATRSEASVQSSSSHPFCPPDRSNVVPGPDPGLRTDGTVSHYPDNCTSLFFPGTDDEEEMIREDLVDGEQVAGTDGGFQCQDDDASTPSKDGPMDVDKDKGQQSDDASSPPPTQSRRKNHRISFILTQPFFFLGALFLKIKIRAAQLVHAPLLLGPDTAYPQVVQGSKPESKKKKKDVKAKFKETEGPIPCKRSRDEEGAPAVEKPAPKKLKSTATTVDDAKVARPSKAVRKRGPAPSKPPAVTMRVSGGGFGEKVPASAKEVENGIKSIGVLAVDRDFRDFVEVDKAYWNKEVSTFVFPVYTERCDHCKRLGTQCRKFLTNMVICVCCHYSKLPCKVNGITALNPISHYRPNGYKNLNAFEGALDTLAQHADSLEDQIIGYMASIDALTQLNGLRVQAGRLRECAIYNKGSDKDNNSDGDGDDEDEGIAEGVAGPSKKKAKSG
ncbi:hypothetical protein EV421DRAFT_1900907 [Armillaria borealis]|uniref:Uncharacterized protein n=1 Tax=Armillaria borealis TaxID=47425 RepID=A0AA39MUG7_9AGAR|nr:hypothetical protein EV421DRAFT_1900907 [Armillaria borealis]